MYFIFFVVLFSIVSCENKEIVVNTEDGQVKGEVVELRGKTIDVFKGIRFGKPPVGDLRFKRPEKVDKWTDVYDATTEKSSCYQIEFFMPIQSMSEDCLFLNVWAPHNAKNKAVMVWLYGGGLQMGSIWQTMYNALPLATFDVVVVAINYRVGPLGFIYDGTDDAPGNVGLYDQLLGLKWVQENIHAFGGNRNEVTIFGVSGGSWAVSYHILSPLSNGLFKNAILQSGSAYSDATFMTKSEAIDNSKKFSQSRGCNDENNWMNCLKELDAKELINYSFDFFNFFANQHFLPVVGEAFYPVPSFEAHKKGKFNSGINILAGITADEGTILVFKWFDDIDSDPSKFNQNIKDYLIKQLNLKRIKSIENKKKVIDHYISDETDVNMIKNKTAQIFGDYYSGCPTYYVPRDMMLWSEDNNVFMYKLTYKSKMSFSSLFAPNESWVGISNGDDIEFVMGGSLLYPEKYSQQEYQFTFLFMNLWSNFAKTGNPMQGEFTDVKLPGINLSNVKWPTLKVSSNQVEAKVMELNPQKFGNLFDNPFKRNCEDFWEPILKETMSKDEYGQNKEEL